MLFSGKLLAGTLALASLFVAAGYTSAAIADTKTQAIGNPAGTPFSYTCPAGQGLVGWIYNSVDHLSAIGPLCQTVEGIGDTATAAGATPDTPAHVYGYADERAKSGAPITCPDNGVMRSLSVFVNERLSVHHIRATCKAIKHAPVLIKSTATDGGTSTANSTVACETRTSYATGIFGTFKPNMATGGILSLGLVCFSGGQDTANADTGDDDNGDQGNGDNADTGDQGNGDNADQGNGNDPANAGDGGNGDDGFPFQLEINIGPGNNGINFGPKGKTRVLKDASTLYSDKGNTEIAYFDKGDKVVVVGCEQKGKGWCQVVQPQPGLIWGGDLK